MLAIGASAVFAESDFPKKPIANDSAGHGRPAVLLLGSLEIGTY